MSEKKTIISRPQQHGKTKLWLDAIEQRLAAVEAERDALAALVREVANEQTWSVVRDKARELLAAMDNSTHTNS